LRRKKGKEVKMVGILIVSHGRLAEALISSVESLVGKLQKIRGVSIWPKDKEEKIKDQIQKEMAEVEDGEGVVILTDILGGTPTNLSLSLLKDEKVEVVTGVNMPMLMTLLSYRTGRSLREIGKLVKKSGRRSIILAKGVLGLEKKTKAKNEMSKRTVRL
jgi:PTS system mannose-specific IIA component